VGSSAWIDVTEPLGPGLRVWPGDPEVRIEPVARRGRFRVSRLTLSTHAGTHVDPPRHWFRGRLAVDAIPPRMLAGEAVVVTVPRARLVRAEDLAAALAARPRRVLVKTANSSRDFSRLVASGSFAALSAEAARAVVAAGVELLGIDGPSVDPGESRDFPAHRTLLENGVVIVEGLRLARVGRGRVEVVAAPLKLVGADGAPARVFVRRLSRPSVGPPRRR